MTDKGRPKKPEEQKRKTRSFRLTDSEFKSLEEKAANAGMEKTEYIVSKLKLTK